MHFYKEFELNAKPNVALFLSGFYDLTRATNNRLVLRLERLDIMKQVAGRAKRALNPVE